MQNFRAKPGTAMQDAPEPGDEEFLATVATTRLVFGPRMHVQAPPNLSDPEQQGRLLDAGIDDWGGVSPLTPDHVNPERPWPAIDVLTDVRPSAGARARERLTIYPEFALRPDPFLAGKMRAPVAALMGPDGLAQEGTVPEPVGWQIPRSRGSRGRRSSPSRRCPAPVCGPTPRSSTGRPTSPNGPERGMRERISPSRIGSEIRSGLAKAEAHRPITDEEALSLFRAEGDALDALCAVADGLRREAVGEDVTYVVNRNVNFTNVCYVGCRFCAFAQREIDPESYTLTLHEVADRAREAAEWGCTEVCMQGGIHPDLPGSFYFDLLDAVKAAAPDIHIHAFSPMEVLNGSTKLGISFREFLQECRRHGLGTIPGTAAEILDDDVRWVLTKGKLPADVWEEIVRTAHDLGIRSSSTIMFGHVDAPPHWVFHIRRLARIQRDTGGFTEFVPLPFVHQNAPIYLAGKARPGPSFDDNRRMHAVARPARRSYPQRPGLVGEDGRQACQTMLNGGANDFGGTLMEETISRMAGAEWGIRMEPSEIRDAITSIGRTPVERSTTYERLQRNANEHAIGAGNGDPRSRRVSNHSKRPFPSRRLTEAVNELDHRNSSHNPLHLWRSTYSILWGRMWRCSRSRVSLLPRGEQMAQNHTHVISGENGDHMHHYIPWQERARCRQHDPRCSSPRRGFIEEAKRICADCPVRIECLNYALRRDERYGVWGGMSERERRRLKRMAS